MTNTTPNYWSADGTSLQTYAQNIETLGGTRRTPPKFRGTNITIPYRPGTKWVPKVADERILTLAMWVKGCLADGSAPTGETEAQQFDDNWRTLSGLLFTPGRQFVLQKHFSIGGGSIQSASALAEFSTGLEPTMIGRNAAKFTVDIKLADPYFYDDAYTTFNLVNGANAVVLPGDTDTLHEIITINGPRTNPVIQLTFPTRIAQQVEYAGVIGSGDVVTIDVNNWIATTVPSGGAPFDSTGKLEHAGSSSLFALAPGTNSVHLASDSGTTGTVQLQGKGAWF